MSRPVAFRWRTSRGTLSFRLDQLMASSTFRPVTFPGIQGSFNAIMLCSA